MRRLAVLMVVVVVTWLGMAVEVAGEEVEGYDLRRRVLVLRNETMEGAVIEVASWGAGHSATAKHYVPSGGRVVVRPFWWPEGQALPVCTDRDGDGHFLLEAVVEVRGRRMEYVHR